MTVALRRVFAVSLCTLAAAVPTSLSEGSNDTLNSGWAESVVVERVFWPVRFTSARNIDPRPDDCAQISAEDIKVYEDGRRVPVTHLDRASLPTIHAILFDTSFSMRARLAQARDAALAYVRETAPDEPVLLASFDDSLILRTPLTRDLPQLERAIGELDLGNGTDLWSSVYHLVRFLESLPGRKVVVLLSDGLDTHGVRSDAFETARWFAGTTPNLSIYPIGLQIPDDRGYVAPISRSSLDILARVTGGKFLVAATPSELEGHFRTIRELLDRELFVTYVPPPFGEGPKDDPDEQSFRLRKVSVRVRVSTLCRLAPGIPRERFVGQRTRAPDALSEKVSPALSEADRTPAPAEGTAPACLPLGDEASVRGRFDLPRRWMPTLPGESAASLSLLDDSRFLLGEVVDIVRESGQLYDESWLAKTGGYVVGDLEPLVGRPRTIAVEAVPIEEAMRALADPLDVLLRLLRHPACEDEVQRSPLVVNGRTFQHLRRYIGQALFDGWPEYRAFAVGHFRAETEAESRTLLRDLEKAGFPDVKRAAVLNALRGRAQRPDAGQPQRLLADWLADVPISRLARRMETGAIDRLLAGADGGPRDANEIDALWPAMLRYFPAPVNERVRVPLILAHDAARDRFGFYRFVLPRFRPHRPPAGEVPPAPLAIRSMRRVLDASPAFARSGTRISVDETVAYESLEGRALLRVARRLGHEPPGSANDAPRTLHAIAVTIPLVAAGDPGRTASIREVWGRRVGEEVETRRPMQPLCRVIELPADRRDGDPFSPLAELARSGERGECP